MKTSGISAIITTDRELTSDEVRQLRDAWERATAGPELCKGRTELIPVAVIHRWSFPRWLPNWLRRWLR